MSQVVRRLKTNRATQKALAKLSPFELKDNLIQLSKETARQSTATMLNAGRVYWYNPPSAKHTTGSQFWIEGLNQLPRVEIFYAHGNMGRDFIDHAVKSGVKVIVIAGVGDGNMSQVAVDGLQDAVK